VKPAASAGAVADTDAIHTRLEKSINEGRSARGDLTVGRLQSGDTIYVDGNVRAVIRREGNRPTMYWLDGDLDLRRSELKVLAPNKYQVLSEIRGDGALRREFAGATSVNAREPAAGAAERSALEKSINDGRTIAATLEPSALRTGDVLYVNGSAIAVVRRSGRDLSRYWVVGQLDLQQAGLQPDGANKYRVVADTVR
jgi:uncharacterized protein with beta-barrel porin domain